MDLEESINDKMDDISRYTNQYLKRGKPFDYISRLAIVGQKDYDVDYNKTFEFGINAALDKYLYYMAQTNPRKDAKLESLVHGAICVIRYVNHNVGRDII